VSALYTTVDKHEPCQLVATHPLRWHDREDPAVFLVEAKYTTSDVAALVEAAQLVMHDRDASDDESKPVEMMRKALAAFED